MSTIFGGSKQSSTSASGNKSYDFIQNAFGQLPGATTGSVNMLSRLLGGDATDFNAYKNATGFDSLLEQGSRGITGNAAAGGLLRSGSTSKALANYGNTMQNQYANSFMDRLLAQAGIGLQAGNLISGAGQWSTGTSSGSSSPGIAGFLGSMIGGAAASDPRLKKDVTKLYELPNGLGVYEFTYINDFGPFIGVMANEVAEIQPEALGPVIEGFMTVDYTKINLEA